jgi:hypothetical protein
MVAAKVVVRALHPVRAKGEERYRQVGPTYVESIVEGVTALELEKRILRKLELGETQYSGLSCALSNRVTHVRKSDGTKENGMFSILGPEEVDSFAEDVEDGESGADLDPGLDTFESVALCTALECAMSWIKHKARPQVFNHAILCSEVVYVPSAMRCV